MKKYKLKHRLKNKLLFKLIIITLISIIIGILYMAIISTKDRHLIKTTMNTFFKNLDKINYLKELILSLSSNLFYNILIWLLGISIIGIPIIIIILLIKSFILGFTISSILYFYKLKGILISIIYLIPLTMNLFTVFYLSYYGIIFSKNLNSLLFLKKEIDFKNIMKKYFKILLISIIISVISSLIEIYIIPIFLKLLQI